MSKSIRRECSTRLFVAWFLISTAVCAIYAIVVYASLVNKNVLPADPGPDFIPFTNIPIRYNVSLKFDSSYNKVVQEYSGEVSLLFNVRDTSNRIFIHAGAAIKIGKCSLRHEEEGGDITVLKGVYNPKTEIQTLIPTTNLTTETEYRLNIEFDGKLGTENGPKTFYYTTESEERRNGIWFSTPRASPKGLRYLFPSMDSSQFPALFDFSIRHRVTLRVLSNFKSSTRYRPPYLWDNFQATARLYSTQVGLVLCDFPFQRQEINGTQVTLYYQPTSLSNVNLRRLQQFMDKTSNAIGKLGRHRCYPTKRAVVTRKEPAKAASNAFKIQPVFADVVVVPNAPTVHLPGLSILNEKETVAENNAINGLII